MYTVIKSAVIMFVPRVNAKNQQRILRCKMNWPLEPQITVRELGGLRSPKIIVRCSKKCKKKIKFNFSSFFFYIYIKNVYIKNATEILLTLCMILNFLQTKVEVCISWQLLRGYFREFIKIIAHGGYIIASGIVHFYCDVTKLLIFRECIKIGQKLLTGTDYRSGAYYYR